MLTLLKIIGYLVLFVIGCVMALMVVLSMASGGN